MSRLTGLGVLLSIASLVAACSSAPVSRQERVSPTLALAPGTAQFLAPSGIVLRKSGDGAVLVGGLPAAPDRAEARVVAAEARRAVLEGESASVWAESIVHGYCVVPERPATLAEPRSPLPTPSSALVPR